MDVSGQLGFFVQQYGLMVLLALAVIVLVVLIALLARSGRRKRTAETAQGGQTIAVMDMPGEPPILDVTEVGNVHNIGKRNYQQDAFGVSPLQDEKLRHSRGVLAVLADGMGGMTNSGELSQAAVLAALRSFPQVPGGTGETLASVRAQRAGHGAEALHGFRGRVNAGAGEHPRRQARLPHHRG